MKKLLFVAITVGVWGMGLFWIALEPPQSIDPLDAEVVVVEIDVSCDLGEGVEKVMNQALNRFGVADWVPGAKPVNAELCGFESEIDNDSFEDSISSNSSYQRSSYIA